MAPSWRLLAGLTLLTLAALVSGQVTFSRDWSGGKRSPAALFDCGQFARICRHFLHDLRSAMSPAPGGHKPRDDDLPQKPERYDDDE
ncbi:uncharacterized protein LOC121730711 [Aricia agestis]|uniref:uncharacterized protein LOC121730711 n=1 Tax=Aricia agestis TaxID=91739 RepID=UPI001C207351|nr:uncharacterized protein LOC121730711 [Aricia agestis]